MKKIKLCVAGLLLSGMSYGQSVNEYGADYQLMSYCDSVKVEHFNKFQEIEYRLMDLIDAVRMDMYYGRISQDNGAYYINEIAQLQYENKQLMATIFVNFPNNRK
tara:strand:- start:464 stop:778 length:315 start_codon:yes stop_codon:yes gene_type:complete